MKEIQLTQGKSTIVDDEDFPYLNQFKWYHAQGYAAIKRNDRVVRLHKLILNIPKNYEIDHKNNDKLDNRKENLRICTHAQNVKNRSLNSNNTSGYKGVDFSKIAGKWRARINLNGKSISLGYFRNKLEATFAYKQGAFKYHKEFANFGRII